MIPVLLPSESLKEFHKYTQPHINFKENTFISHSLSLCVRVMKSRQRKVNKYFQPWKALGRCMFNRSDLWFSSSLRKLVNILQNCYGPIPLGMCVWILRDIYWYKNGENMPRWMSPKINSSIDNVLWISISCIILWAELSKWRKFCCALHQIDLVQRVLSSLCGFSFHK